MRTTFTCVGCDAPMPHAAALADHSTGCDAYRAFAGPAPTDCTSCAHEHWTPKGYLPCPVAGCACPRSPASDILTAAFGGTT